MKLVYQSFLKTFMVNEIKIETTQPKLFTKKAIAAINAYGILAIIPIIIAIPLIILIENIFYGGLAFSLSMVVLALAIVLPVYFFSIVIGNPYVQQLVRSQNPSAQSGFVIQLTNLPRVKSGFWAFMEDADDVGFLSFEEEALVFSGDSTNFLIPFALIKTVCKKNVGWRGLWIYGNRIVIDISGRSFEFAERFSLSIPASRKISKDLFNRLSTKIKK